MFRYQLGFAWTDTDIHLFNDALLLKYWSMYSYLPFAINLPTFFKKRNQFYPLHNKTLKQIATKMINIERITGLGKLRTSWCNHSTGMRPQKGANFALFASSEHAFSFNSPGVLLNGQQDLLYSMFWVDLPCYQV